MNWDQIQLNWKQWTGNVKKQWGRLTDDDLTTIAGKRDQLVGTIQQRYGFVGEVVERELNVFTNGLKLDNNLCRTDSPGTSAGKGNCMATRPKGKPAKRVERAVDAVPRPKDISDTYDGNLVAVSSDGLVISTAENKQHQFKLSKDAYLCCDGVICLVENLKVGNKIRLTVHADQKNVATIVESLANQTDFADHR